MSNTKYARQIFIQLATQIMAYRMHVAAGIPPPDWCAGNPALRDDKKNDYYIDELIKEIHKLTDLEAKEVTNSKDVLKLLGQGTITVAEAKELMSVLHQQVEIDLLPELIEKMDALAPKKTA